MDCGNKAPKKRWQAQATQKEQFSIVRQQNENLRNTMQHPESGIKTTESGRFGAED